MSLDDLIAKSKSSAKPKAGNRGGKTARGAKSGGKDDGLGVKKSGVNKGGRGGGRGGGIRVGGRGGGGGPRPPKVDLDRADKWEHDMFTASYTRGGRGGRAGGVPANVSTLVISNLDYNVTSSDIKELFVDYKSVRQCTMSFDRSGRSEGTATVVFDDKAEASRAKNRYTNMSLDGKVMKLELVEGAAGPVKKLSSGIMLTKVGGRGGDRGGNGAGRMFQQAVESGSGSGRGRRNRRGGRRGGGGDDMMMD